MRALLLRETPDQAGTRSGLGESTKKTQTPPRPNIPGVAARLAAWNEV